MNDARPDRPAASTPASRAAGDVRAIQLFLPEIRRLLRDKRLDELEMVLSSVNPIDLADGWPLFSADERRALLPLLEPRRLVQVFEELNDEEQQEALHSLDDRALSPLLEGVPADVAARLFRRLPDKVLRKLRGLMRAEDLKAMQSVIPYPSGTVGALMHGAVTVGPDITARSALERLQTQARTRRKDSADVVYVTEPAGKLLGGMSLRTLVCAPPDLRVKDFMSPVSLFRLRPETDQEEAAKIISRYKLIAAPVVDAENRLIGVVGSDDALKVIESEATEDIQKLAGMEALEEPYLETGFTRMLKKRATWLCVLFVGEMLTATAMAYFEDEIAKAVVLALFIPLIISSGGNSGSQAATLIVRALALKEITFRDWWRVLRREFAAGFWLGAVLGGLGFLRIYVWGQFTDLYGPHALPLALAVATALLLVVMWGTLSGSLIPLVLKRVGLDPAVASVPFVATMVDVVGLVIYFTIAFAFLRGTLL
jgi:magnesium transporter